MLQKRPNCCIDAPGSLLKCIFVFAIQKTMKSHGNYAFEFEESTGGIEAWRLLSNSLRVLVAPQAIAPVVTVNITYLVGSGDEIRGHTGATHFLEHLLFKGTKRFNRVAGTDITRLLQRVGAEINATTSMDRTNYYATLPVQHLELALEIEADRMRSALLGKEDMEAERTVILNELDRQLNDPGYNLFRKVWSTVFTLHPYHHPVIGWREDVSTVSRDALRTFYDTYYWPGNATLSIVGAVDADRVLPLVARHFEKLPASPGKFERPRTAEPPQDAERRVEIRGPGHMSVLIMAYRGCEGLHDDTAALAMLGRILAWGKNSRLWRHLTDSGKVAQIAAGIMPLRDPGIFSFMAVLVPGRTHEEVEEVIDCTVQEIQADGPSREEMERAKVQLAAEEAFSRDGSFGVAAGLNEAIAVGKWQLYTTGRKRLEEVSAEDVQRVAQTYLQVRYRTSGRLHPVMPFMS